MILSNVFSELYPFIFLSPVPEHTYVWKFGDSCIKAGQNKRIGPLLKHLCLTVKGCGYDKHLYNSLVMIREHWIIVIIQTGYY